MPRARRGVGSHITCEVFACERGFQKGGGFLVDNDLGPLRHFFVKI